MPSPVYLARLACLGAVLLARGCLLAQMQQQPPPDITTNSAPSSADLQGWLAGKDPRHIAWAAYFAGERGDIVVLDALVKSLPNMPGLGYRSARSGPEHDAALVVLDTLIRQHQQVSVQTISEVSDSFPEQALLLASQLPPSEAADLYANWYNLRNGEYSGRLLARISTLLLGNAPPASMVASVLNEAEQHLVVTVHPPDSSLGSGIGFGSSCGDGAGGGSPAGWPGISSYYFEEDNSGSTAPVLVAWPGERITYVRHYAYGGYGSCYGVSPLDAKARHGLLAHWLGVQDDDLPWPLESRVSIVWTTRDRYLAELGQHVESAREILQGTVQQLVARKLLSPEAAASAQPRLLITVLCTVKPCPLGATSTASAPPDLYSR